MTVQKILKHYEVLEYTLIKYQCGNSAFQLPALLVFRFEEASLTLPQCYVENKKR